AALLRTSAGLPSPSSPTSSGWLPAPRAPRRPPTSRRLRPSPGPSRTPSTGPPRPPDGSRWPPTGRWPPTTTVGRPRPQRPRRRTPPAVLSRPPAAPPATEEKERLRLWVRGVRRDRPGRARFDLPPGLGCLRLGLRDLRRRIPPPVRLGLTPKDSTGHNGGRVVGRDPRLLRPGSSMPLN